LEETIQTSSPRSGAVDVRPPETPDIAALTRAMARGDEAAFREFYDAYFDRLLRYLLVVTGGHEEAAREALQLALVRVVRHVKPFEAEEKFWSWLTVLARSALSDQTRKRRRYLAFLDRFTQHARVELTDQGNSQPDTKLLALLDRSVAALPPDERALVERKYFARRSVREIAGELQMSEKAVESRLVRIRRKIKDTMLAGLNHE
jgi:RNA polymerase sigma-70 factor (ECF subfamily)